MPKHSIDYQKCLIYKIQHNENEELVYVGHTTDFIRRQYSHKKCCNNKNVNGYNYKLYNMIRSNGGWEMFSMVLIHNFPCNSKLEACKEEDKVIREIKATMNANNAVYDNEKYKTKLKKITDKLIYLNELKTYFKTKYKKEYYLKYYLKNKQLKKSKLWYEENKDVSKQYYIENKEHISNIQKDYRDKNQQRIDTLSLKHRENSINKVMNKYEEVKHNKYNCVCGSVYIDRPSNHNNHLKSLKHKNCIENQNI